MYDYTVLFSKSVNFFSCSLVFIIAVFSILRCMIFHWSINPNWFNHFPTVKHFGSFQLCLFIWKAWSAFYVVNMAVNIRDINSPCSWQIRKKEIQSLKGRPGTTLPGSRAPVALVLHPSSPLLLPNLPPPTPFHRCQPQVHPDESLQH